VVLAEVGFGERGVDVVLVGVGFGEERADVIFAEVGKERADDEEEGADETLGG
jgi:hypothetical protein